MTWYLATCPLQKQEKDYSRGQVYSCLISSGERATEDDGGPFKVGGRDGWR